MSGLTHAWSWQPRADHGEESVTLFPIDIARVTLEQRLGTLPETAHVPMIAVFGARTDRVESNGYAWTCRAA